jgi:hypothetical protein
MKLERLQVATAAMRAEADFRDERADAWDSRLAELYNMEDVSGYGETLFLMTKDLFEDIFENPTNKLLTCSATSDAVRTCDPERGIDTISFYLAEIGSVELVKQYGMEVAGQTSTHYAIFSADYRPQNDTPIYHPNPNLSAARRLANFFVPSEFLADELSIEDIAELEDTHETFVSLYVAAGILTPPVPEAADVTKHS